MITQIKIVTIIFCIICISSYAATAADLGQETPSDIAVRLQHRYDTIQSISFTFSQETKGDMTGPPKKGKGKAFFYRGKNKRYMRWDYISPDVQVLASDGEVFSMYFAKLKQMIVTPAKNLDNEITYSFFMGNGNIFNDFDILPADNDLLNIKQQSMKTIKLVPKTGQSQVQDIQLSVTPQSLIKKIMIRDHFGTITILNFSNIKLNNLQQMTENKISSLFRFHPPEGTEIVHQ